MFTMPLSRPSRYFKVSETQTGRKAVATSGQESWLLAHETGDKDMRTLCRVKCRQLLKLVCLPAWRLACLAARALACLAAELGPLACLAAALGPLAWFT